MVAAFEPFRAPLTPEEVARRHPSGSPRASAPSSSVGIPFVLRGVPLPHDAHGPVPRAGRRPSARSRPFRRLSAGRCPSRARPLRRARPRRALPRPQLPSLRGQPAPSGRGDAMSQQVFSNARIVLRDEVVHGSLVLRDGRIAEVAPGAAATARTSAGTSSSPASSNSTPTTSRATTCRAPRCAGT